VSPRHHPSEDRLLSYAAGTGTPGADLVIAAHVGACRQCRDAVALAEAVGGALLDALPPAPMSDDALALALARIERPANAPAPKRAPAEPDWIEVPEPVLHAARRKRRWAAPGVWVAPIGRGPGGARSYLLRVGAGMSVPRHTHRGAELVCVLKGAFSDRGGLYEPGDFSESDESVEHMPTVTPEGECVCLICADGALVPRDWVGRFFQPFVRI
jgi:putative transcriptional regulator